MILLAIARFLLRTPWSTGMAFIGVTLGVTSIVGVHLISASIAAQLDALIPAQLAGYSHFLHRDNLTEDDYIKVRQQWREGLLPGVEEVAPIIDESTTLQGREVRVIGVDLLSGIGFRLLSQGSDEPAFTPAGASPTAQSLWRGVWIDSSLKPLALPLVNGVIKAPAGTLIADIAIAQDLLGWPATRLSYVGVVHHSGWQRIVDMGEKVLPGFAAGFPLTPTLQIPAGWTLLSLSAAHPASSFGKSVLFNISALGLLALLVAWFLIYQVAVSWLRRLWPVFERLHVLGVDWSYLQTTFVCVLLLMGILAAFSGLLVGRSLATFLYQLAVPAQMPEMNLDVWVFGKALLSAVGVCSLGGVWAFRQMRLPPTKTVYGLVVPLVLMGAVVTGIFVEATGLAGGFLSIAGLSLLAAWLVTPLLKRLKQFSIGLPGPVLVRLSAREAIWYPHDMGVALAGLILAVATAIGVSLMVDSFRSDFSSMLEQRLSHDLVVEGQPGDLVSLQKALVNEASVSRVQSYRQGELRVAGVPMQIVGTVIDMKEALRYGYMQRLAEGEGLISEQAARVLDVDAGERIKVGANTLQVVRVFTSFGDVAPRIVLNLSEPLEGIEMPVVSLSVNSVDPAGLVSRYRQDYPDLDFRLQRDIRILALETFDQTFAITTALVLIALLVASLGIYVAVTAMRLNKKVQMKVLTALGVNRLEMTGMDFALGFGIGLVAMLVAIPLGLALGWILCAVINPRAFGWTVTLQPSFTALMTPVFWGLLAASAAGLVRLGRQERGTSDGHS